MRHLSVTDWADFARGVVTTDQRVSMQKHLDEGCSTCKKTVEVWTSLVEFARHEDSYKPPATALRCAESYLFPFKLALREKQDLQLGRLTFDSFESQMAAGIRGFDEVPRQLMYQCGDVVIDMRLEPKAHSNLMALAGQVVDSRRPAGGVAGIPVSILSKEDTLSETTTNQFGEFHFSFQPVEHLKLLLGMERTGLFLLLPDSDVGDE